MLESSHLSHSYILMKLLPINIYMGNLLAVCWLYFKISVDLDKYREPKRHLTGIEVLISGPYLLFGALYGYYCINCDFTVLENSF